MTDAAPLAAPLPLQGSITDVPGVLVGHVTLDAGDVQTGVTAILPYPPSVRHRKLFAAGFGGGRLHAFTGLAVLEDFGTLSSPIVLCNSTTVGVAYDALITLGHRRDPDLPTDEAWPPVVIGIDDGYLNNLRLRKVTHDDVLRAVLEARGGVPARGSVGIGRGLSAFGAKGGVGCGSRALKLGDARYVVGALLAANGGARAADTVRSLAPSFVAVLATDAPLLPEQLRGLAEAALRGLDGALGGSGSGGGGDDARLSLAFSTGNPIDGSLEASAPRTYKAQRLGEEGLGALFDAAAITVRAALFRALTSAEAVTGRHNRSAARLSAEALAKLPAE
jgi:D-aminopeptidase